MSIVEVAKEAGVSHATVSYVINGKRGVSAATAKRVQLAMNKLNYIPRSSSHKKFNFKEGQQLAKLKHGCIGIVFYGKTANMTHYPFYARLCHSIEEELRDRGLSMMLISLGDAESSFNGSLIDGAVICGFESELAHSVKLPFVSVAGHPDISEPLLADHIEPANDRIGVLAADYFASRGHKKVAFFDPTYVPGGHPAIETRRRVFMDYAKRAGLDAEAIYIRFAERKDCFRLVEYNEVPALQEFIQQFAKSKDRPTGIFVPMDSYLVVLQKGFAREGIRPGRDVEFIGCNNEATLLEGLDPRPATIDVNPEEMGKSTVERILHRICQNGNGGTYVQIEVQPKLVESGFGVRQSW
jgi:LacI family transcriptional regulator